MTRDRLDPQGLRVIRQLLPGRQDRQVRQDQLALPLLLLDRLGPRDRPGRLVLLLLSRDRLVLLE